MTKRIDLTGHKYGRLTVISRGEPRGYNKYWNCLCDCGNKTMVQAGTLRNGKSRSCGCLAKESSSSRAVHRECGTRLYGIWLHMKNRCNCKTSDSYYKYGAVGVTVCEEWNKSYLVFKKWAINNGYSDKLSIDRISCSKLYSPSTCRWANSTTQSRNRLITSRNSSGFIGVYFRGDTKRYSASVSVNRKSIPLGCFDTASEAGAARDKYIIDNNLKDFTMNSPVNQQGK